MTKASEIRLDGRAAIVTGAAHGLGRAMAQALLRAGADVVFADIDVDASRAAVAETALQPGCGKAMALPCDISEQRQCERTTAEAVQLFGGLHILVNNAAKGPAHMEKASQSETGHFWEADATMWAAVIETNIVGSYFMARAVAPHMLRGGWGRIVNVSTSLSTMQRRGNSPYGVSKAAIEAETLIWAKDLAGTGVTCNSLLPGGAVDTAFVPLRDRRELAASGHALLEVDVMVAPILWLASPLSNGVTARRFIGKFWKSEMTVEEGAAAALEAPVLRLPDLP